MMRYAGNFINLFIIGRERNAGLPAPPAQKKGGQPLQKDGGQA